MTVTLHQGDCLEYMRGMEDSSVDLIATDPPYYKVKGEWWDNQWDTAEGFLSWLGELMEEWHRILKPNGSLYVFASPKMAARVEVLAGEWFNVLNNIRWEKEAGWHNKNKKEELRGYLSPWEAVIFAEHYNSDNIAKGEAGYHAQLDKARGFLFEPLRAYLDGERMRAGVSKIDINVACGFSATPGGMASRHYFSQSQWWLPTEEHYKAMQELFNNGKTNGSREYLKREYEHLKREYEHLRRPFNATPDQPYTDVWAFGTVNHYPGKHPTEKPLDMMRHIVNISSRDDAVVFDPFMGSGTTGVAAVELGRNFIGCELSPEYFKIAEQRIEAVQMQGRLL